MILGTCMSNGIGDKDSANKLGSLCYRLTAKQALDWNEGIDQQYILLMSGAKSDKDYAQLGDQILSVYDKLIKKPFLILCQNEQNEISYELAKKVNEYIRAQSELSVPIIKGPFTCCVERAGQKAYEEMRNWCGTRVEALNYYEVPSWESFSLLKNMKRRYRFRSLVKKLRKLGVLAFLVTEFHAGSKTRQGYDEVHGDYLYHSKKDFDSIIKFLRSCDVNIALYYQAAFIGRNGNDIV